MRKMGERENVDGFRPHATRHYINKYLIIIGHVVGRCFLWCTNSKHCGHILKASINLSLVKWRNRTIVRFFKPLNQNLPGQLDI